MYGRLDVEYVEISLMFMGLERGSGIRGLYA